VRLVETLSDEDAWLAAVPEEPLGRPRQPAVAVGEIRPERLLERGGGPLVDGLGLLEESRELAPDDVDVHGDAGVLERDEADLQRALDEARPFDRRALRDERREARVEQDQPLDHDPIAVDADGGFGSGQLDREGDDAGFHDPILDPARVTYSGTTSAGIEPDGSQREAGGACRVRPRSGARLDPSARPPTTYEPPSDRADHREHDDGSDRQAGARHHRQSRPTNHESQ